MRKKNKQTVHLYVQYTNTFYILCLNILSIKLKMHLSFYKLIRKYFCLDICICLNRTLAFCLELLYTAFFPKKYYNAVFKILYSCYFSIILGITIVNYYSFY